MAKKKKAAGKAAKKKPAVKKAAKKVAKKAPKVAKKAKPVAKKKRAPNPAFMRPLTPSAALSAVIGSNPLPRTMVTKKLWDYIRKNGCQDAVNRRMINADDKLRPVFGGRGQVSMFEMTALVGKHLS